MLDKQNNMATTTEKTKVIRTLLYFDYRCSTGFANVSKNLVKYVFSRKHKNTVFACDCVAINYHGETFVDEHGIRVISAKGNSPQEDDFGRDTLIRQLNENEYDFLFVLNDLQVLSVINPVIKHVLRKKKERRERQFKSMFYFPIDGNILRSWLHDLDLYDSLVTYTTWGRDLLRSHKALKGIPISVIPHGNDFDDFYPLDEVDRVGKRLTLFGEKDFVVTSICRNQPRKDVPATMVAWKEFVDRIGNHNRDKVLLYLHMNPQDSAGFSLPDIAEQLGIADCIKYPDNFHENVGFSIAQVNDIYNASDLLISTTLGEGWGLPITEAMATKTAILAPMHSSIREITRNGELIGYPITSEYMLESVTMYDNSLVREKCNPHAVADLLYTAYATHNNPTNVALKASAYQEVTQLYDWKNVAKKWQKHIFKNANLPLEKLKVLQNA